MTWAGLKSRYPAVKEVVQYLDSASRPSVLPHGSIDFKSIEFKNVSYAYPGQINSPVLRM